MHKVQELGLGPRYGSNAAFRLSIFSLGSLAFLPVDDVVGAYDKLAPTFTVEERPLLTYFATTWVGTKHARGPGPKAPMFELANWNVHDRAKLGIMLTNNNAELFHRHHRAQLNPGNRPHMHKILRNLHDQQRLTDADILKVGMGQLRRRHTHHCQSHGLHQKVA